MIEIVLGPEWDDDLLARLRVETEAMGGSLSQSGWTVAGSQERTVYRIALPGAELEAEAETYVGLVLRGDEPTVRSLANRVSSSGSAAS
jgi:hypothetical protein